MDSPSGQRHESIKLADEVNQAHRHGLKANHVATKAAFGAAPGAPAPTPVYCATLFFLL